LKDEGFGELLPAADAFIVDEAHQLPDVANQFFGASISARQLQELARDAETEYRAEAGDLPELLDATAALDKSVRDFRLLLGPGERRDEWSELTRMDVNGFALGKIDERLGELEKVLEALADRGSGLQACYARCQSLAALLDTVTGEDEGQPAVRWFETTRLGFRLVRTPLDIAEPFSQQLARHSRSWIFTSATLAVGDSFEHFKRQIGIEDAATGRWESPFDYPNQALWYVPRDMPDPRERNYTVEVIRRVEPVLEASRGRAFLLFTSHRALQEAAGLLAASCPFPLLVQGTAPRNDLLERFRAAENAVLLGAGSFWEGVDVPGKALSLVVIDKLPFAPPGDPVMRARLDSIRTKGGNASMPFQVPQAGIALKQGAGRLIRDAEDRGVLMTCDPRMLSKSYGRAFINAMPPFARTRREEDVIAFFKASET
jgi:ATP-dependent DNA helicase DinG